MNSTPVSGKDKALELAERAILASVLSAQGTELPDRISRLLDLSPHTFESPHAGAIAQAIQQSRNNGKAPDLIQVVSRLTGAAVYLAQELANSSESLPLILADAEAEPLLARWRSRKLIAVLGEAWEEARSHPDKARTVGKIALDSLKSVLADMPDLGAHLPDIETSDALVKQDLPIPPEIIKGFLHQGLKGVLGSSSKARKTWILMDMGIAVSEGLPFWHWDTIQGKVLYINFEIPREFMRSRLIALRRCRGLSATPNFHVWNLRGKAAPLWKLLDNFIARIKREGYCLVIIDPIYKSLGDREENAAEDVAQVCNEMERIAVEAGCAVVYAAHFSKGNQAAKESIDRISGSGVWARDADSLMIMTKHEADDCYTIETVLRNLPEQPSFVVRWNYPIMEIDHELDPERLKKAAGRKKEHDPLKLLAFLRDTSPEKAMSIPDWAEKAGIGRTTLNGYLEEMRQHGWILTVGEGRNSMKCITEKGRKLLDGN